MDIESLIPEDGSDAEKSFKYTAAVCASIHVVFVLSQEVADQACLPCELNPSSLLCTCKTFRGCSLCPHVIAATALFMPETYTAEYLDELLEIISSKRGVKRPRKARGGTQIQPDSSDDEPDEEPSSSEPEEEDEDGF